MKHITSTLIPLVKNDIDTDQIIPARFLKGTDKLGFGQKLFYDWRYEPDETPRINFELNDPRYAHGRILLAGHNFGCGSSREHAPWALKDFGFQAVVAVSFADIFSNNALKNQLLPVALPEAVILALEAVVRSDPSLQVSIDIPAQRVQLPEVLWPDYGQFVQFSLDPFRKTCLIEETDEIGYTLSYLDHITAYEAHTHPGHK